MTNPSGVFSPSLLANFLDVVLTEVSAKNLPIVLGKSELPKNWADKETLKNLSNAEAAQAYAGIQQAIRNYYGRGARGILQRIGSKFWDNLLDNASLKEKAQSKLLKGLPETRRHKAALEMLPRLLGAAHGSMVVHTLDLNLMLVDNTSPATLNQNDDEAICYVTQGLIREAIYWASEQDPLIEETSCRAIGSKNCEFKITFGGS